MEINKKFRDEGNYTETLFNQEDSERFRNVQERCEGNNNKKIAYSTVNEHIY